MVIQFYSSADVTGEKCYALIETGKDEVFEGFLALSRAQNFSSKRAYMRQEKLHNTLVFLRSLPPEQAVGGILRIDLYVLVIVGTLIVEGFIVAHP